MLRHLSLCLGLGLLPLAGAEHNTGQSGPGAVFGHIGEVCFRATSPADLEELEQNLRRPELMRENDGRNLSAIALRFVEQWKEYLTLWRADRRREAWDTLKSLLDRDDWVGLVPRSPVLERYAQCYEIVWATLPDQTIDDLPKTIAVLKRLDILAGQDPDDDKRLKDFLKLQSLWEDREHMSPARLRSEILSVSELTDEIIRFKLLMLARILPDYLSLPPSYKSLLGLADTAPVFLKKVIRRASERRDLISLWRASQYYDTFRESLAFCDQEKLQALDACLTGDKQLTAGAVGDAAASYLAALQGLADSVVVQRAVEGMSEIRKSHPEAAAAAGQTLFSRRYLKAREERERNPFGQVNPVQQPPNVEELIFKY